MMGSKEQELELLWLRLHQAKLELDESHRRVSAARQVHVSGEITSSDGFEAYVQALSLEKLAFKAFSTAFDQLHAALSNHQRPKAHHKSTTERAISEREREVLQLVAEGKSSLQIAEILGIAFKTVVVHRQHLHKKLKVHRTVELVREGVRRGLVQL